MTLTDTLPNVGFFLVHAGMLWNFETETIEYPILQISVTVTEFEIKVSDYIG